MQGRNTRLNNFNQITLQGSNDRTKIGEDRELRVLGYYNDLNDSQRRDIHSNNRNENER